MRFKPSPPSRATTTQQRGCVARQSARVGQPAPRGTTALQKTGFYLLSLAVLALFGWDAGAISLAAIFGGIALVAWCIAGLGGVAVTDRSKDDDLFLFHSDFVCNPVGHVDLNPTED